MNVRSRKELDRISRENQDLSKKVEKITTDKDNLKDMLENMQNIINFELK
jgi:DNA invertase Pin-like site-specific DNA recombinase